MRRRSPILFALRLGFRADRRLALVAVGLAVVEHAADATPALLLKLLVNAVARGDRSSTRSLAILLAVSYICGSIARNMNVSVSGKLVDRTGHLINEHILRMAGSTPGVEHFERPDYLDKVSLLRSDQGSIARYGGAVVSALGVGVRIVITVGLLASVHPALLALPIFAVPSLFTGGKARRAVQRAEERVAPSRRLAPHYLALAIDPVLARETRIFGLADVALSRNAEANRLLRRNDVRADAVSSAITAAGTLSFTIGYIAAIAFVAALAARGNASPGDVALAVILGAQVNGLTSRTVGFVSETLAATAAVDRYRWLIDYSDVREPTGTVSRPSRLRDGIQFDGVTFRYPGTTTDVISDLTLDIPAGSILAIVGENGAGKSTLVKLLLGFYQPTNGAITVDGQPLDDIDPESWRSGATAAFQDFMRYEFELRTAVGVGHLPDLGNDERILRAMERGHGADLATKLEHGLDTQLGRRWSGGTDLSGGQWQRSALSRTMMRPSPLLLVLDEPTSALDPDAEHALFEDYARAGREAAEHAGAITVLISHRFSTVRMADTIVVLADGSVAERGSHQELLTLGGVYAELFELQAKAYR